jgi:hypothetical protein
MSDDKTAMIDKAAARKTRRRTRWLLLAVIVVGMFVFHAPLLRRIGGWLCVDDGLQRADYLVLLPSVSGDGSLARSAANEIHEGTVRGVMFFAMPPTRGEQCGALPSFESGFRGQLAEAGVAESRVMSIPGPSRTSWEAARALGIWLGEHPEVRVAVLCPEFRGRYERYVVSTQISSSDFSRVAFITYPNAASSNWWTSRETIQMVFQNYIRLGFVALNGETGHDAQPWSYDEFLRDLPAAEGGDQ